jgi:hypothetical protein
MQAQVVRVHADWLSGTLKDHLNVDQGVNAQLAAMESAGTFWPAGHKPPNVAAFLDELTDPEIARRQLAEENAGPWLAVLLPNDVEIAGEVRTNELDSDQFSVLIGYGNRKTATHELARDTYHTMRAVRRSVRQLHRNENVEKRKHESIQLVLCRGIRLLKLETNWRDLLLTGGLVATYLVRELAP